MKPTSLQDRVCKLIAHWAKNPPKRGIGLLIPRKTLKEALLALLAEAQTEAYNAGYDDGFSDGLSSEGL